jgi:hypothetical protein
MQLVYHTKMDLTVFSDLKTAYGSPVSRDSLTEKSLLCTISPSALIVFPPRQLLDHYNCCSSNFIGSPFRKTVLKGSFNFLKIPSQSDCGCPDKRNSETTIAASIK